MIWLEKTPRSWLESFVIKVLQSGPIPQHVAFIMDGNRRYADKFNLNQMDGHSHGFQKLSESLDWCLDLGIKEVTVYAFSIENFKRSKEEVENLMQMIREKLKELMEEKEKLDKYGVCVRVLGDISLLPSDIQKTIADVVLYSRHNNSLFINVCLAYTSQEEMCRAAEEISDGVSNGLLKPEDISEELFDQCMYNSSEPDIVVRTSGEVRLSDFLLWQSSYSLLSFVKVLWPEFSIWHLFASIWNYQHCLKYIKKSQDKHLQARKLKKNREIYRQAVSAFKEEELSEEKLQDFILKRQERTNNFLLYLKNKRLKQLEEIKAGKSG